MKQQYIHKKMKRNLFSFIDFCFIFWLQSITEREAKEMPFWEALNPIAIVYNCTKSQRDLSRTEEEKFEHVQKLYIYKTTMTRRAERDEWEMLFKKEWEKRGISFMRIFSLFLGYEWRIHRNSCVRGCTFFNNFFKKIFNFFENIN